MKLSPDELLHITHLEFRRREKLTGKTIIGVSTDSRTVREGELFVALRGGNFDGHKFLAAAFEKGCVAAVVDANARIDAVETMPLLVVQDTTRALGEIARYYRSKFAIPFVAVGGSNGKTTTKDMIASVLRTRYHVLHTEGNLNNHLGVPQTLFRLEKKHDIAVIELGTNHLGEIAYLCEILDPTHGVITNIGREHLEFFKTIAGVAKEEAVLFATLHRKKGAVAFVNADDKHLVAKSKKLKTKVTYAFSTQRASVCGNLLDVDARGCAEFSFASKNSKRSTRVKLSIPGKHNAQNALAAATIGLTFKVPAQKIKNVLERFTPASKRMETVTIGGIQVLNDSYNANPDSMLAALHTLASTQASGKRIAVLADMKELGEASGDEHTRIGKEISSLPIDYLLTFGEEAKRIYDAAKIQYKFHYDQKNMLAEYLVELVGPGDAVLIKGSRSMKMEDILVFMNERLSGA
ncbi:MAG: UDP-N-acetylmuramoyl-tripeptide--D-alanyl-D-alanine ligase [Ignavibacteriae bacterium]|nr:UDP-N-acetylmuramoyl-tripeptide--D-alanyl-D-alanine ligase [Ignavibacteriota bacterium]